MNKVPSEELNIHNQNKKIKVHKKNATYHKNEKLVGQQGVPAYNHHHSSQ